MSNEEQMRKEFEAWFIKNYPADTIIAVPEWHAPKIYQAATASKQQEIDTLRQQLVEQAALVEKMREALHEPLGFTGSREIDSKIRQALALTPSTALAEHDNEVAAKALEYEATQLDDWHHSVAGYLRDRATERRSGK